MGDRAIESDRELVRAAQAGDLDSFGRLCERYYAAMAAIAYSTLRDHQLAEDAAQETFARALVNLRKLKTPEKFAPWLAQICRHAAIDMGRARRRMPAIEEPPAVQDEPKHDSPVEVNIFRRAFRDESNHRKWSYDFWVDAKTKRLVAVQVPGADIYDPQTDPARNNPLEKEWSTGTPACFVKHDIDFDAELDDSLFNLDPPPGYAVQSEQRAQVTEAQMIEYLGIMADYNDKTFPDQPYSIDVDRLNQIDDKSEEDRTPAEQRLRDITHQYMMANLNLMPTGHFIKDHTVEGTFRYLGKGVKLGDADRIVCWYKLKDAGVYRAVYGDLSVRDVAPKDLPLPVEP